MTYSFGFIKDVLMERYEQPLVCSPGTYRYSLPPQWVEVKDYVDFRVVGILTMARRLEHVTNASGKKWGEKGQIKMAMMHVRHLREQLEAVAAGEGDE